MPTRRATATWNGTLKEGEGNFEGESGAVRAPYNFGSRFGDAGGTNPEELLAAAEAACFSMALAGNLEREGARPQRVRTEAGCTVEKQGDGFKITTLALHTRVSAEGVDDGELQRIASQTKETCPVSLALKEGVEITLEAELE
ncbi:MAG: OsmC family peroxiredoxin [Longimicrobiaceae bacterium]